MSQTTFQAAMDKIFGWAKAAKPIKGRLYYELLLLDLGDGRRRPFLKMTNPSTGDYEYQGVPPNCKTVEEAICFRNGLKVYEEPNHLT